jgi:CRP/FNR family transcriptional regulator, cyclic AMP receptor protein
VQTVRPARGRFDIAGDTWCVNVDTLVVMAGWPMLDVLEAEEARGVLAAARRRSYRRGEVVFHRDDPADTMHLVRSGCLAVRVTTPLGDVATLQLLGPGQSFGELALLRPGHVRTATVEALGPVETYALSQRDLDQLRAAHPEIGDHLLQLMADRVADLTDRLVEALYTPAPQRVRRMLDSLAERYGEPSGDAVIPLTQDDLAGLAGTSRLTVNRVLQEMRRRGLVEVSRGRIRIVGGAGGD